MSIPKALIDNIREGNIVLFLGAGASIGAIHNAGKSMVDGKHLAEMLIDKYLGPEYKGTS